MAFKSESSIREQLRAKIGYRKQARFADRVGISRAFLHEFLAGKKGIGPVLLVALGYEPIAYFRRAKRGLEAEKKGKGK